MSSYPIQRPVWTPTFSPPPLQRDELHIWRANLDQSHAILAEFTATLSPDEQERVNRFRFPQHRQRSLASRGILRSILARYLHQPAEQLQFHYTDFGKPELAHATSASDLHFNVTHSEALGLFAIARSTAVGIDVEMRKPMPLLAQLIERYCSTAEQATIAAQPPNQQEQCFFYHWTAKEALTKATGRGITDLAKVQLRLTPQGVQGIYEQSPTNLNWQVYLIEPKTDYVGAIADAAPTPRSCFFFDWQHQA